MTNRALRWWLGPVLMLAACRAPRAPLPPDPRDEARSRFARMADAFIDGVLYAQPYVGVRRGLHGYDGRLPDLSATAIAAHLSWLDRVDRRVRAFSAADLTAMQRVERAAILAKIAADRYELRVSDAPRTVPLFYLRPLSPTPYIAHRYAPATRRARALSRLCRGAPTLLATAARQLDPHLARPQAEIALFVAKALSKAARGLPRVLRQQGATVDAEMTRDLAALPRALDRFVALLAARLPHATAPFALGKKRYLALMRSMGIELDLARFEQLARRQLDAHRMAIVAAARRLDHARPPAVVIRRVLGRRPSVERMFAVARQQVSTLRQLLLDKHLVSIPSDEQAVVAPTPPFLRFNFAFLDTPGVMSGPRADLRSTYYISPPNPKWPPKKQREYAMAPPALYFATAHEVWPGHFLDYLHAKTNHSRTLHVLQDGMRVEGWAHYVEQMVLDDGLGHRDPKMVIGMLFNALLRDVRFIASIGLHTQGKSVAWAAALFRDKAYVDAGNAQQQARRGTFDPSYFRYTVGKLMIEKLRADMTAKAGGKLDLKRFHDRFLDCCAMAPIPAIRRALLGDDAGPAL